MDTGATYHVGDILRIKDGERGSLICELAEECNMALHKWFRMSGILYLSDGSVRVESDNKPMHIMVLPRNSRLATKKEAQDFNNRRFLQKGLLRSDRKFCEMDMSDCICVPHGMDARVDVGDMRGDMTAIEVPEGSEIVIDGVPYEGKNVVIRKKWNLKFAKDGDILTYADDNGDYKHILIFEQQCGAQLYFHADYDIDSGTIAYDSYEYPYFENIRPANYEEKMELINKVTEDRHMFDEERRIIRYKPQDGDVWYIVDNDGWMFRAKSRDHFITVFDNAYWNNDNCFATKEEAEEIAERLNDTIKKTLKKCIPHHKFSDEEQKV